MSQQGGGAQEAMQKFGRFLSGMVMPNIGAFIAWGFLTALFIPTGWMPNEYLAQVGGPMSKWLIPLLIGYSGGAAIYGPAAASWRRSRHRASSRVRISRCSSVR